MLVPAARARELIGEALAPLVTGMESVRAGVWIRALSAEVTAVVSVAALEGAQHDITYGIGCAWVPVRQGRAGPH